MKLLLNLMIGMSILCFGAVLQAQNKFYPNLFPSGDVQLLDGPFKHARDLNIQVLLKYDVDRLLAPYRKQAGLPVKAQAYPNWDGLDGHVGGHYLSALAINYAATNNQECKKRMEYMLSELDACQKANTARYSEWGAGYAGGMPNSAGIWSKLRKGDFSSYFSSWAPWYNLHKTFAGLRDAWLYGGSEASRGMFLRFCDWAVHLTSGLSDEQMQTMLGAEQGGMNEVLADAFQMTGDAKYAAAAKRFSHRMLLDAMAAGNDNLDNKHANTQIPKVTGFERIAELTQDDTYAKASRFFWNTVTTKRSLVFGGNSRKEHFPSVAASSDYIEDVEGPESCNSYNMLKLTADLFRADPSARYIDYYERTLYNHILSTQHPVHGGYVYFTPARPRHYRVYSAPNEAMWCCVGTGMENHGLYNQMIYTHRHDSLFVNLFIASELTWREKGITLRQTTVFPYSERVTITVTRGASHFPLLVRYPSWVKDGAMNVRVNGRKIQTSAHPSAYVAIDRMWTKGDVVQLDVPMHTTIEHAPNMPSYIAIVHGPILLGAKTGTEDLKGLVADDGRWGQTASGPKLPLDKAPILIEDDLSGITRKLVPVPGKPLTYTVPTLHMINPIRVVLQPFFTIHDARYMMYWMALTHTQYRSYLDSISNAEKQRLALDRRTLDAVAPGEQQPEVDHHMQSTHSHTGTMSDVFWRDASDGGSFSYDLATRGEIGLSVLVRYWGYEWGKRTFEIYVDADTLAAVDYTGKWYQAKFQDVEYPIPESMTAGKDHVRIKFQAAHGGTAGAVYSVRLLKKKE